MFRGDMFTVTLLGPVRTGMCPPIQLRAVVCGTVNAGVSKTTPAFEIIRGLLGFLTEYVPAAVNITAKELCNTKASKHTHAHTVKRKETQMKYKKKPYKPLE